MFVLCTVYGVGICVDVCGVVCFLGLAVVLLCSVVGGVLLFLSYL